MTIKEFIDKYAPDIDKEEFVRICNSVGIKINSGYNETMYLDDALIKRLIGHNRINTHRINVTVIKEHNNLLKEYDEILSYYDGLLAQNSDPKNDKVLPQDRAGLQKIRNRLAEERKQYSNFVKGITERNLSPEYNSTYMQYGDNGSIIDNKIAQKTVNSQQRRIEKKDDKLSEKYAELEALENELNLAKTKFKKNIYYRKTAKVRDKINKLRNNKGKIASRQRRIINNNAKRLKNKVEENLAISIMEAQREGKYVEKRIDINKQLKDAEFDYQRSESELGVLENSEKFRDGIKFIGKSLEASVLESKANKLERRLKALERKNGACQFFNQIHRDLHTYAFG